MDGLKNGYIRRRSGLECVSRSEAFIGQVRNKKRSVGESIMKGIEEKKDSLLLLFLLKNFSISVSGE